MAHIYLTFDFGTDEEKAQQARHRLDGWKQAFRLDKKLIYKFDRSDGAEAKQVEEAAKSEKNGKQERDAKAAKGKGGRKSKGAEAPPETRETPETPEKIKLLIRLAFSNHEKLSEQRWVERIPAEEPFKAASPATLREGENSFEDTESRFDDLD